jgi:hypothetical protein
MRTDRRSWLYHQNIRRLGRVLVEFQDRSKPDCEQACFREELRRSGTLRKGIVLGFLDQRCRAWQGRLTYWLRQSLAAR